MRRKAVSRVGVRTEAESGPVQRDARRPVRRRPRPADPASPRPAGGFELGWGSRTAPAPHIADNLPHPIPLAERELDLIESYLGALLDDILGQAD